MMTTKTKKSSFYTLLFCFTFVLQFHSICFVVTAIDCPGPSLRRAWRDLSCEDRETFLNAVTALKESPEGIYDEFVSVHYENRDIAHGHDRFLPWHRWYIWKYEKALQDITNNCDISLPYWDWERDYLDKGASAPFEEWTFGSATGTVAGGSQSIRDCVNEGVCDYTTSGWSFTLATGGCLKRDFNDDVGFAPQEEVLARLTNFGEYFGFRPALEGAPHAAPHIYVGQQMASHHSPDDPLFFLHHANVDRIWALWQDYWNFDDPTIALGSTHYSSADANTPMQYMGSNFIDFKLPSTGETPTPFDMHYSYGGADVSVTYVNDNLAAQLVTYSGGTYAMGNNPNWISIATAVPVPTIDCTQVPSTPAPNSTPLPTIASSPTFTPSPTTNPPTTCALHSSSCFSNDDCCSFNCRNSRCKGDGRRVLTRQLQVTEHPGGNLPPTYAINRWNELMSLDIIPSQAINQIAKEICNILGNPRSATEEWIVMNHMENNRNAFECHME